MHKIATTTELQRELERILAYARSAYPSRAKVATELLRLSARLEPRTADVSEGTRRNRANKALGILCRNYHQSIPLPEIKQILAANGFDENAVDGIYTGREGESHEQVGPRSWIKMTWHKMESGNWEIVAYLS